MGSGSASASGSTGNRTEDIIEHAYDNGIFWGQVRVNSSDENKFLIDEGLHYEKDINNSKEGFRQFVTKYREEESGIIDPMKEIELTMGNVPKGIKETRIVLNNAGGKGFGDYTISAGVALGDSVEERYRQEEMYNICQLQPSKRDQHGRTTTVYKVVSLPETIAREVYSRMERGELTFDELFSRSYKGSERGRKLMDWVNSKTSGGGGE